jgi:CMP-N-acetylneuraminic acid synthetase
LPYKIIPRPEDLAGDNSSHHDVMIHGLTEIERMEREDVDILVILLGNSLGAEHDVLDEAVQFLIDNPDYDSIQSVSEFNMFNPFRAFTVDNDLLKTCMSQNAISSASKISNVNDKNSAGDIYFANGSFFICRRDVLMKKEGLLPFPWLGYKIKPWIQDVTMEIDAYWQSSVLRSQCE